VVDLNKAADEGNNHCEPPGVGPVSDEARMDLSENEQISRGLERTRQRTAKGGRRYTALGYSLSEGLPAWLDVRLLGRVASHLCRARGIVVEKVPSPAYGSIGTYPVEILDEAVDRMRSARRSGR
jgi:hypothetical protein